MTHRIENMDDLRRAYYSTHPNGHFFDSDTLKFFGERFSEMRLLKGTVKIMALGGEEHECYVVSSRQRIPMVGTKRVHHYFDATTLDDIQGA